MGKRYTFLNFLNDFGVTIPVIQRDYAFGRITEKERREKFLKALFAPIVTKQDKCFDFVYGRNDEKKFFMPLDGQQRLTTLWLIHWVVFHRAGRYADISDRMKKFKYETRISSTRFCQLLADWPADDRLDQDFVSDIIDSSKFDDSWLKDPTIEAMLEMLRAIGDKIQHESIACDNACDRLLNSAITFDLLDMADDQFKLTDSLYVKMNARGKQLTDFEDWKAEFIDFLDEKEKTEEECNFSRIFDRDNENKNYFKTYKEYFAYAIEHNWTDLFWSDVYRKWDAYTPEEKQKYKYPTIDNCFMNVFFCISEMLYYRMEKHETADFTKDKWPDIYSQPDNLEFLFNAMDALCEIKKQDGYWGELFDQLSMFDVASENKDLFARCINYFSGDDGTDEKSGEQLSNAQKIVFYFLLHYCIEKESCAITQDFKDVLRVVRNVAVNIKQLSHKTLTISSNVRMYGLFPIFNTLEKIIADSRNIYDVLAEYTTEEKRLVPEIFKAKLVHTLRRDNDEGWKKIFELEEMEIFKSDLRVLPLKTTNIDQIYNVVMFFVKQKSLDRTRLLTAFGFSGAILHDGHGRYFGKENLWQCLMQYEFDENYIDKMQGIFLQLAEQYQSAETLLAEDIINNGNIPSCWSTDHEEKLRYYILKYPEFVKAKAPHNDSNAYFHVKDGDIAQGDFIALGSFCSWRSYNIDPFVYVLQQKMDFKDDEFDAVCFRDSTKPSVIYKEKIKFSMNGYKWNVEGNQFQNDFDDLQETPEYRNADLIEQGEMIVKKCRDLLP